MWLCLRATALIAVAAAACSTAGSDPTLTGAAAVSMTEAMTEVAEAWHRKTGRQIEFTFAASNTLARQILQGAPVDVFVSADRRQMERVAAAIEAATRTPIAQNALVIIVPGRGRARWSSADPLRSPDVARIAVGNPEAVPAGAYAKEWLEQAGLWGSVESRLIPTVNVRAALAAVNSGSADAAIVYRTDARQDGNYSVAYDIPPSDSSPIVYYAAVTLQARDAVAARAFVTFLAGPEGAAILTRRGFDHVR